MCLKNVLNNVYKRKKKCFDSSKRANIVYNPVIWQSRLWKQ